MITIELRQYQIHVIKRLIDAYKANKKSPCIVLPCGAGKSNIMGYVAKNVTSNGGFVLLILHRQELHQQMTNTFLQWGINKDLFYIGMVQGMKSKINKLPYPDIILVEEGHHGTAKTYRKVFDYFKKSKKVFFTATPIRLSGEGLNEVCDELIVGVSTKWLIENGYLANYKYFSVPVADFKNIKIVRGEYDLKELQEILENNHIYGDTVQNYIEKANGKKTIVYCCSVESAKQTALEFQKHGFKAESLDGKTNIKDRMEVMEKFRSGDLQILTNFILFGEGIDIPDCDCIILARKVHSLGLFIQMTMRCMRANINDLDKVAIIIDQCGNVFEHGFPDDDRPWKLEGKIKQEQNEIKIKTCNRCYNVMLKDACTCSVCGTDFTSEVRRQKEIEIKISELVEIKRIEHQKLITMSINEINNIKDWGQLSQIRGARGYKIMWQVRKAIELNIPIPANYEHLKEFMK